MWIVLDNTEWHSPEHWLSTKSTLLRIPWIWRRGDSLHPLLVPARYIALQLSIARYIATINYCIALSQPLSQATAVNFSTNLVCFVHCCHKSQLSVWFAGLNWIYCQEYSTHRCAWNGVNCLVACKNHGCAKLALQICNLLQHYDITQLKTVKG